MPASTRLMIIDDDPDYVYLLQRCLEDCSNVVAVAHAQNGKEALELLASMESGNAESRPDIALLDISMPVMNGFEFLDRYESTLADHPAFKAMKFFVISSSDSAVDREKMAKHRTVLKYLVKPVECEDLLREIGVA